MLHAFVDETGDRGKGVKSSRYFIMASLVIPENRLHTVKDAVAELKRAFDVPPHVPLHWVKHCKSFERRQYAAKVLSRLEDVRVNYVIFEKSSIPDKSAIYEDGVKFYNYVAGIMLERVLLTSMDWSGPDQRMRVFYEHVRGFRHEETSDYFVRKQKEASSFVKWQNLAQAPTFIHPQTASGLQAADLYAGILRVAIQPDKFGGFEHHHFFTIMNQIRTRHGRRWGAGFKVMARPDFTAQLPWWGTWPKE